MNEEQLQRLIEQGNLATELLRNESFNNLVAGLKEDYFNQWVQAKTLEEREKIHAGVLVLEDMVSTLMNDRIVGDTASKELAKELGEPVESDYYEYQEDQKFWPDNMMES